ncbi:MAG TPA: right-handed parallel beta-helix repeat-containing protein [Solirubrobacterales bacterium]
MFVANQEAIVGEQLIPCRKKIESLAPQRVSRRAFVARICLVAVTLVAFAGFAWPEVSSATALPEKISENMTLTTGGSPYTGSPTIESGVTMTIEAGVELTVGELIVKGTLKTEGTAEKPVVFKPTSKGFKWKGLVFKSGSGASLIDHAEVIEAGYSGEPAITIDEASPRITNSVIRESTHYGISVRGGGAPEIDHNTVNQSGSMGILYHEPSSKSGEINIHDNSLDHNGGSATIYVEISGSAGENITAASLGDNVLSENSSTQALSYNGGELPPDIGNNISTKNSNNSMAIGGALAKSGTWTDHGGPIFVSSLKIEEAATLNAGPGLIFQGGEFLVHGTFNVEGTAEDPVVFKRQSEVTQYRGLIFKSGSGASVVDHAEVIEAGYSGEAAITIDEASPRITNSTVRKSTNWGIAVKHGGAPEIDHNTIRYNDMGILYHEPSSKSGEINIHDNSLDHNGGSATVYVEISGSAGKNITAQSLGANALSENSSLEAIYYNGGELPPDIGDNTLTENYGNHITVSGIWAQSGIWTPRGAPIYVGSLEIAKGKTLTAEPGTIFQGGTFTIKGSLKAEGTAEEPVVFKAQGGSPWRGLLFEPGSGASVLDHVEVIRAGYTSEPAIAIDEASPTITNSTVRESTHYGIKVRHGGSPEIDHNTIRHSGSIGILYGEAAGNAGDINIHDNNLNHNGDAAIYVEISGSNGANVSATSLGGNTLRENRSTQPIYYNGGELPPDIDDNGLHANNGNQITLSGTLGQSATWSDRGAPIIVSSLKIPESVTLTAEPGLAFEAGTFTIEGTLLAEGTAEAPVVFQPQGASSWRGLLFEPGSDASVLDHAEVIQGGYSSPTEGAIMIDEASPAITNSTVRESTHAGILTKHGAAPTIEWNLFRDNSSYGILNESAGTLSAPHNDWGCEGGPGSSGCDAVWQVEWKPAASLSEPLHPCIAGSSQPGPKLDCLLYRYAPKLVFDSQESFYSDSPAEIVENWGDEEFGIWGESNVEPYANVLLDADAESPADELARSGPGWNDEFHLDLSALGTTYPNEFEADSNDWIDARGSDEETYVKDAQELESFGGFKDRSYGMQFKIGGKIWLQYWYFYYYNGLGVWGVGVHEGDWESVQIGLDSEYKPEVVVLSQHSGQVTCNVEEEEVETTEAGAPIVYLGRGSHANYPTPGSYELPVIGIDHVDGEGETATPSVENLGASPSWLSWEGHWGNTHAGFIPGEADSPTGPAFHDAWTAPDEYAETADECFANLIEEEGELRVGGEDEKSAVAPPAISATDLEGRHPKVTYRVPGGHKGSWPRLILSVDEKGDGLLPATKVVRGLGARDQTTLPYTVNPKRESVILASLVYKDGRRSPVVRRLLKP